MSVAPSGAPSEKEPAPLATRTLDRCLACGGTALRTLPFAYEYRGRFPAAECRNCGMRFLTIQPAPEALATMYTAGYFESDFRCGRSEVPYSSEEAFREENRGLLDEFERLTRPGRLLEVGCAGGWLLKHAIERGWRAQGVELSADAVAHARALGLEVFHGDLIEAHLSAATFDLAYMGDVLEHVPDCRSGLTETARLLRPGGLLYLRGPITTNSLARGLAMASYGAIGRTRVLREPPYHLWEFTPRSLARLFEACGLEVVELHQSKIAPGRARGRAASVERTLMAAVDALNVPLTRVFNVRGDRVVMVGRRRS